MSGALPGAIALAVIPDGSPIIAADHRNNYGSIQGALNNLLTAMQVTQKGDLLVATAPGALANLPVGANGSVLMADSTQPDGMRWAPAAAILKKNTAKVVNTTIATTDMLNGEITLPILGATSTVRITAWGDMFNNTGGTLGPPSVALALNAVTLASISGVGIGGFLTGGSRAPWTIEAIIENVNATNVQWCSLKLLATLAASSGTAGTGTQEGWSYIAAPFGGVAPFIAVQAGAGAVDTTVARALTLLFTNASASAAYESVLKGAIVEVL